MKFFYIKTDKSEGWAYNLSLAGLAIAAENCGHIISEIKDITEEPNGKHPTPFKF
jgi:hypothetical protein